MWLIYVFCEKVFSFVAGIYSPVYLDIILFHTAAIMYL